MASSVAGWPAALADAIRSEDPDAALRAGLAAADSGAPPLEVARTAAVAYAGSVDVSPEYPPHGLLALSAAVRLARHLPPRLQPLPILQALTLAAADAKLPDARRERGLQVSGEISHLTRSFECAVRTGAFEDAVSIFSGLLREGRERVMAGDVLFRVAAEDMAIAGHKLIYAVKGWQLAAALGWRSGDVLMGPVVARIATGIRDPRPFQTLMAVWGRERMDAEAVGGNAGPADEAERAEIRSALRAPSPEACARGAILALKRGVSLGGVASAIFSEAAGRVAAADRYDLPAIHGLIFAGVARWVLRFSKTSSRIVPILQAGLVLQALPVATPALRTVDAAGEDALLRRLAGDMEAGAGRDAADRAHTYVTKGFRVPRLLALLAHQACREGPAVNLGHNLILADAVLEEATANPRSSQEPLAALARMLALSPRDRTAWASLEKRFGPAATSS